MDRVAARGAADYHQLVGEDSALAQELEEQFLERMRAAHLTFGGRVLCSFPRPNFLSAGAYEGIRVASRLIFKAMERAEERLGCELWDRVDMRPEERDLAGLESGYRCSAPTARLDSFMTPSSYRFVELNAESPAGIAYNEALAQIFLELQAMKRFQERYSVRGFQARGRLLGTLLECYREAGGAAKIPLIAIVDYDEVPTRPEHHLLRDYFESRGYPALVCDPRRLVYEKGRLRHEGTAIDVVYRRLLVNDLIAGASELGAFLQAVREQAVVMVNPFRCKALHKKAIFAVLTEDDLQGLFTDEERGAIALHVPWTRRVQEQDAWRRGELLDLPEFILKNRESLVMKPNDEYGGTGVFIGWEMTDAAWEAALAMALKASYVVQERVFAQRQSFPELNPGLGFRDVVVDLDPFLFAGEVEGFLTRLSSTSLANVSSGGGQVPSFLVEPR